MYPKKSLGQNFLKDPKIAEKIVGFADVTKNDTIIEIGPGTGILTEELVKTGASIFAIEKDFDLITKLQKYYKNTKNLKIVHQDALFFDTSSLRGVPPSGGATKQSYKVVSNLPFNMAAAIIRKFLENQNQPELMVVMTQKEVAEKIVAKPGDSERGILTLSVEFYADAEIVMEVSKNNFIPQPKVDAAVVKITPKLHYHLRGDIEVVRPELFFRIVKAGFSAKRRQIHNSLAATLRLDKDLIEDILKKAKIDPMLRAEDLSLEQWLCLCQVVDKNDILKSND